MTGKISGGLLMIADVLVCLVMIILFSDLRVSETSRYCVDRVEELPQKKLGVVLGTAKYRVGGGINPYYQFRIDAAATLFHSGKVDFLLISGDNAFREYDEPTTIKNDLTKLGVAANRIFLDYAGFRTFDSMIRCKEVFGETDIIVVSQQFHNERALYIAHHNGMTAIGYNARDVGQFYGLKTMLREKLARTKTLLDVHVLNTVPRFLGDKITIEMPDSAAATIILPADSLVTGN